MTRAAQHGAMTRAQAHRWRLLHRLHIWLGVIVGLQLLLWTASGLLMSSTAIETVRGDHLRRPVVAASLAGMALAPLDIVVAAARRPVDRVELTHVLGRPAYRLFAGEDRLLADAATGARWTLSAADADTAARAGTILTGPATVTALDPAHPPLDLRRNVPGWQVAFEDGTHVYVGATGDVLAIRTRWWRIYDIAWGTHILDLKGRENTHHPFLIGSALLALVTIASGMTLLVVRVRRGRL